MSRLKTQLTMATAAVLFLGGTAYGVKLLTAAVSDTADAPTCEARTVTAGGEVTTNLIKVNVFNASQRSGLANRVTINLQRNGFLAGQIGNSTGGITTKRVAIVTTDSKDPRIQLVAQQFKDKVSFEAPRDALSSGVTVIVGDDYSGLKKKATRAVKSDRTLEFCLPTVTVN